MRSKLAWTFVAFAALAGCNSTPAMTETDSGTGGVDAAAPACMGPAEDARFGTSVGSLLRPFTLNDCAGNPVAFYNDEWCSESHHLTVVSIAAGWCNPCRLESMQLTERVTEPYRARGVRVIQILVQDEDFGPVDGAYCQAWVDNFDLTNIQLIDSGGVQTGRYFPDNALPSTLIIDDEGIIRFRENGASDGLSSLTTELDRLLAE